MYLDVKMTVGGGMIHHVQLACPVGSEDTLRAFYAGCWASGKWSSRQCSQPAVAAGSVAMASSWTSV
jgi:hypothetical protein